MPPIRCRVQTQSAWPVTVFSIHRQNLLLTIWRSAQQKPLVRRWRQFLFLNATNPQFSLVRRVTMAARCGPLCGNGSKRTPDCRSPRWRRNGVFSSPLSRQHRVARLFLSFRICWLTSAFVITPLWLARHTSASMPVVVSSHPLANCLASCRYLILFPERLSHQNWRH